MANQISEKKTRISLAIEKELVEKLDREAKETSISRTALIMQCVREHFDRDKTLDLIEAKLDTIQNAQIANAAAIIEAVRNQPIAIAEAKHEALPKPEPQPEYTYEKSWFGLYKRVRNQEQDKQEVQG